MNPEKAAWYGIATIFVVVSAVMFGLAWLVLPVSPTFYQIGMVFSFSFFVVSCVIVSWAAHKKQWPD